MATIEEIRKARLAKLARIQKTGVLAYPGAVRRTQTIAQAIEGFSQLSKNIENACIKARRWGLVSKDMLFFLKTQDFKFHGCEINLSHHTSVPQDIIGVVSEYFNKTY